MLLHPRPPVYQRKLRARHNAALEDGFLKTEIENQTQAIYYEGWSIPLCCHRWKVKRIRSTKKDTASEWNKTNHSLGMQQLCIIVIHLVEYLITKWYFSNECVAMNFPNTGNRFCICKCWLIKLFQTNMPIYCSITGHNKNPSEATKKEIWVKNKRSGALHASAGPYRLCATSSVTQKSELSWVQDKPQGFQAFQNVCSSFLEPCSSPYSSSGKIPPTENNPSDTVWFLSPPSDNDNWEIARAV